MCSSRRALPRTEPPKMKGKVVLEDAQGNLIRDPADAPP
jgi:hypothetical protein